MADWAIRAGIRASLALRLARERRGGVEGRHEAFRSFVRELRASAIAESVASHYLFDRR